MEEQVHHVPLSAVRLHIESLPLAGRKPVVKLELFFVGRHGGILRPVDPPLTSHPDFRLRLYPLPDCTIHAEVANLERQDLPTSDVGDPTYLMRTFLQWLEHVADYPSAAGNVATLIAQARAVGISVRCLRKIVRLTSESLDEVLKGLLASRHVLLLKVNGARVYRVA